MLQYVGWSSPELQAGKPRLGPIGGTMGKSLYLRLFIIDYITLGENTF